MKRTSVEIRKTILKKLMKSGELSFRKLERKVDTSTTTIKTQIEDLESLGFVKIKRYNAHPKNNKPYSTCIITDKGKDYVSRS